MIKNWFLGQFKPNPPHRSLHSLRIAFDLKWLSTSLQVMYALQSQTTMRIARTSAQPHCPKPNKIYSMRLLHGSLILVGGRTHASIFWFLVAVQGFEPRTRRL